MTIIFYMTGNEEYYTKAEHMYEMVNSNEM